MEKSRTIEVYPNCFGCGDENPIGLRLDLREEDGRLVTEFIPRDEHQGWPGTVHGGIIASLLYEEQENLAVRRGDLTMMKSMETRFRRPAPIGKSIVATAWLRERSGRQISVSATLADGDGAVIAEGNAVLVVLSEAQRERLRLGNMQDEQ